MERAKLGHDVPRGSTMNRPDMKGGCRRIEAAGWIAFCRELFGKAIKPSDEIASRLDSIGAQTWFRGVCRMAMHDGGVGRDAFVRIRDLHQSRLADKHGTGRGRPAPNRAIVSSGPRQVVSSS